MTLLKKPCGIDEETLRNRVETHAIFMRIPRNKQSCVRLTPVTIYDISNVSTNSAFPNIPWGVPQVLLEKAV